MARPRLTDERAAELLDGVMRIIAERGFSDVKVSELASELRCSASTLYALAPSKDGLMLVAIQRWADAALEDMRRAAEEQGTPLARSRAYYDRMIFHMAQTSVAFRADRDRYESTRRQWTSVVDRSAEQLAAYLDDASEAGEIRRIHAPFIALLLRQIAAVTRDAPTLAELGLSVDEAYNEARDLIWEGLITR